MAKTTLEKTQKELMQYLKMMAEELNVHEVIFYNLRYKRQGWRLLNINDNEATYIEERLERV